MASIQAIYNCVLIVLTGLVSAVVFFVLMVFVADRLNIKSDGLTMAFFIFIPILLGGILTAFIWNKMRKYE